MSKIVFELVLQDVNAQQAIAKFRQEVKEANNEIKKGVGGDRFKELTEKIATAKIETLKLTEEQKKLRKEFAATQVPTDSLAGLRIAYSKVTEQVNRLSKAERESDFGRNLVRRGAGLKTQIDGIEQSLGRFTGNVGNYKSALLGIGDIITGGLATGGIVIAVQKVIEVMGIGISQAIKYEKALDDLSALTGLTGSQLQGLQEIEVSLRTINIEGAEIVNTGTEILRALQLVGGARPELLKDADALGEVAKQAIVLSQASGDELEPSVMALTTILGQFNLDAKESERVINELAAGAKEGAAEIPGITDSLQKFGTVAKISNISTSESIALIEVLADRQLKGAEAGTQLRNVLTKLASADILPKGAQKQFERLNIDVNVLKDSTIPLEVRLRELGKAQGDLSALTKIFGLENLQAATIITSGIDKYNELNTAIQGTNEAYLQAEIRADNLSTKIDNLQNKSLNSLQDSFDGTASAGSALIGVLDFLVEDLNIVGFTMDTLSAALVGPISGIGKLADQFKSLFGINDNEKTGLQGLDLDVLRKTIDLTTGELLPVTEDLTDALLSEANALIEQSDALKNATDAQDDNAKSKVKNKEAQELVNGSLAFFRDQIDKLKKELDNTPTESPLFKKLQQNIIDAEIALDSLQAKLNAQLDPADIATPTLPTVGGITVPVSLEVENEDEALKGLEDFQKRANENAAKIKSEADEEQAIKDAEKREQVEEAIKEAALNTAQAISNGIFEIQRSRQEREKNEALTALDEETARRIEQAQGNATLIEQIEKDADKKRAQIEKEAAQRAKRLALQQAAIDTALAILKALASAAPPFNFILAGAAAVAGAIQLAVIKKQEFAGGGRVKKLGSGIINEQPNHPRTAKGDNVLALVKSGEMILNEDQQRRLEAITGTGIYGRIGVPMHGVTSKLVPQFANGGFATDFTPQIALPQVGGQAIVVQTVAEISDAQMDMLANKVALQTGLATKEGVGEGLEDNNRLKERQESLTQNRSA